MPFIINNKNGDPSRYFLPSPISSQTALGKSVAYEEAKRLRKEASHEKDNKLHDKGERNWWRKRFKGYDFVCKYCEGIDGYCEYPYRAANLELSPYIDAAFNEVDNI